MTPEQVHQWAREADTTQGVYSESDYDAYLMRLCALARADLEADTERNLQTLELNRRTIDDLFAQRHALKAEVERLKVDAANVRRDALEEAAKVCGPISYECADLIRKLKDEI